MRVVVLIFLAFLPFISNSQIDSSNWMFKLKFGIEKHDKRLFDYSEKQALLTLQPDNWGTFNWSLLANKKLLQANKFTLFAGSGMIYQKATFLRPFDHTYFNQDHFEILRNLNRYEKMYLPITLSGYLNIGHGFYIDLDLSTFILHFRKIDNTENDSGAFPYTSSAFELNSFNITSGLNYEIKRFIIGFQTRLINYQIIDKIIFNSIINDPRVDKKWEFHNPLHFDISVSYIL